MSRRKPPFSLPRPWQVTQLASKIGWMSRANCTCSIPAGGSSRRCSAVNLACVPQTDAMKRLKEMNAGFMNRHILVYQLKLWKHGHRPHKVFNLLGFHRLTEKFTRQPNLPFSRCPAECFQIKTGNELALG